MKHFILFYFLLTLSFQGLAQDKCELSKLSKESKDELFNFWTSLTVALKQKDNAKIISLCHFPFFVAKETLSNDSLDKGNFIFNDTAIVKYIPSIFYDEYFATAVSQYTDPTKCLWLHGNYLKKDKTCGYAFCYSFKVSSGETKEFCFSIVKYGTTYKIDGHWIRH